MNTAEALEKITDRGKFELLVTSVLRKHNRDYAAIIHTGINAQGETIKSPVDDFVECLEVFLLAFYLYNTLQRIGIS